MFYGSNGVKELPAPIKYSHAMAAIGEDSGTFKEAPDDDGNIGRWKPPMLLPGKRYRYVTLAEATQWFVRNDLPCPEKVIRSQELPNQKNAAGWTNQAGQLRRRRPTAMKSGT